MDAGGVDADGQGSCDFSVAVSPQGLPTRVKRYPVRRRGPGYARLRCRRISGDQGLSLAPTAVGLGMGPAAGVPLSVEDGMIGAICRHAGAQLATRNVTDFQGLGLQLINPWDTV